METQGGYVDFVGGELSGYVNAMLTDGVVQVRALCEFLGLACGKDGLGLGDARKRRHDDIGIELYRSAAGPLQRVTRQQLESAFPGVSANLVRTLQVANKSLLHITAKLELAAGDLDAMESLGGVMRQIVEMFLYTPLGMAMPAPSFSTSVDRRGRSQMN